MPIKPPALRAGDRISIVAPASAPPDPNAIDRSVAVLRQLGFQPKLARHVNDRLGYLAGKDRDRADDLMKAFADRSTRAILCVRGGYGAARLLPLLDYQTIRAHPKILIGYSDITSLHCALLVKSNLVSFHGPMLNADFAQASMPDFTLQGFLRTLTSSAAPGGIRQGYHKKTVVILYRGTATGPLIGGNLSLLCTTVGTPWQPSFKGAILFLEDLEEPPYRFDRMLTHLLNAGLLQQVAGIAIGVNVNCEDPKAKTAKEYRQTLADVFKDRLLPLKVPIVAGLPFGHIPHNTTLPIGVRATLDGVSGDLLIAEAGVK